MRDTCRLVVASLQTLWRGKSLSGRRNLGIRIDAAVDMSPGYQ